MACDWSTLPSDPLGAIVMKFDVLDDFIHFSAVCQGWNRATSLVKHQWKATFPSLLLAENTKKNPEFLRKIFNLNDNQFYQLKTPETFGTRCWGSAYGWVAMADLNRNVQLFNPITKAQINFPSLRSLKNYYAPEDDHYLDDAFRLLGNYLIKLIVLKVSRNDCHEFVIMVIYDYCYHVDFARQGDRSWTSVSTKEFKMDSTRRLVTRVFDIVAKNDDIFALYGDGSIVHWHASEFYNSERPLTPIDYSPPGTFEIVSRPIKAHLKQYLVESQGHLIMVVRYKEVDPEVVHPDIKYQSNAFDVFKLTEHSGWEKIEDLGNVALFVGGNYSMSISLGVAQCLQYSRIYFTDDDDNSYWGSVKGFGGHDTGFYDMKLNEIQFYKYDDMRSLFCPSTWFVPNFN